MKWKLRMQMFLKHLHYLGAKVSGRSLEILMGPCLGGACASAPSMHAWEMLSAPPQKFQNLSMQMLLKHPLYMATKVLGKSSSSPSASLRAQQSWNCLSHSGGPLGSLGRFNSFTPCHSLDACLKIFLWTTGAAVTHCHSPEHRKLSHLWMSLRYKEDAESGNKIIKVNGAETRKGVARIILVTAQKE